MSYSAKLNLNGMPEETAIKRLKRELAEKVLSELPQDQFISIKYSIKTDHIDHELNPAVIITLEAEKIAQQSYNPIPLMLEHIEKNDYFDDAMLRSMCIYLRLTSY